MNLICPHPNCRVSIKLPIDGESDPMRYIEEGVDEIGENLKWGHCPNCEKLIVILQVGDYQFGSPYEPDYFYPKKTKIIEPRNNFRTIGDVRIPERYREAFNESSSLLFLSPKASAAMSRRLLQDVLHDHYKIKKRNLSQEIEEFLTIDGLPSILAESVDAIRNIGNFAAHPMKSEHTGDIVDVEEGEADWQLDVLEALLDFSFVQPARLRERKDALNSKLRDLGKPELK